MGEDERRKRTVAAQGFAAVALFVFAHAAHAATPPPQPALPGHGAVVAQVRAA